MSDPIQTPPRRIIHGIATSPGLALGPVQVVRTGKDEVPTWSVAGEDVGREIERRQQGQPPAAVAVAWSAQRRLHRTYSRMRKRNKRATLTTVAVARELAGFCWAIAQIE